MVCGRHCRTPADQCTHHSITVPVSLASLVRKWKDEVRGQW